MMKKIKLFLVIALLTAASAGAQETQTAAQPETQASAPPVYYNTRGGDSYQTAVLPPLGKELKLNHHQKRGTYDYFVVDLKAGQAMKASLSVGEKGVEIRPDNTTIETGYPYAGLVAYDAAGNQLGILDFSGAEKNLQKTLEVDASTPQTIYLLVGSGTQAMNKDYVGFRVDVVDSFDAGGVGEAGATMETALEIDSAKKAYPKNFLTRNDEADFFRIATKPGQPVSIEVAPENSKTTLSAALYDELRVELARDRSASPGRPVKLNAKANTSLTFLKVTRELSDEPTEYGIRFLPPPPETRPAAETRPLTPEIPSVLPTAPSLPSTEPSLPPPPSKDAKKPDPKKKPAKSAWWKDSKTLTWAGAGAGGVLILLLGGMVLLRRSRAKKAS